MAFENSDFVLSQEHFEHIQERHVRTDLHPRASKFRRNFNLVSCLAWLTRKIWRESGYYYIREEGFRSGHGQYFIYVFKMPKVIGFDPWGFPSKEICIYYSWKPNTDARFRIISAYPYSFSYHHFLMVRKNGYLL